MNQHLRSITGVPQDDRPLIADLASIADRTSQLFQQIFQTDIAVDDDFFDHGGDSLAAETLLAGIEQEFSIALPLSILLELSTPRALAGAIWARMAAALPKILFTVSETGSSTPLFCIHGWNGTAAFSRKIRNVLPDRPIYALRAVGLLPGEVPLSSVQEMARTFIGEIRRVRPSGPYHIFGQCGTASVAYEVAQQLSAAGEQVKTVTLGNPMRPKRRSRVRRFYHWLKVRRTLRIARRFPQMSGDERWKRVTDPALLEAMKAYQARPYSGKVLIVAASDGADHLLHPKRGFPALVPHLETVVVEGNHLDVFAGMDPSAPGKLASAMSSFLARHD